MIVAIDGTAASGKGTLAKRLACSYGYAYLDTGLLYRAVGLAVMRQGGDPADAVAAVAAARALRPDALLGAAGDDPALRSSAAGEAASRVAALQPVRALLLDFQRDFCANPPHKAPGAVLDGRDIGTVVAPQARIKFFVTATPEVRAARRTAELRARGDDVTEAEVMAAMQARDARDQQRAIAQLRPAPDAIMLDTTMMDADAVLAAARQFVDAVLADQADGRMGSAS